MARHILSSLLLSVYTIMLSGCRIELVLDAHHRAQLNVINNTDISVSFYVKNEAQSGDIFDDRFRITDINRQRAFTGFQYRWLRDNRNNRFAVIDANTRLISAQFTDQLNDNSQRWFVFWQRENRAYQLSSFARRTENIANVYQVRIFANGRLQIDLARELDSAIFTTAGEITPFYQLDQCDDLIIGEYPVNLCSIGNPGRSYLVVIDLNGDMVISEE